MTRLLPLLLLGLACRPQTDVETLPAPVSVEVQRLQLVQQLMAGRRAWTDGDRPRAAGIVRQAYEGPFAELRPLLRAHDPQKTLELEYAFGRLAVRAEGRPQPDVPNQFDLLIAELDRALRALPQPEAAADAPAPLNGGITTVPAN